MAELAATAAVYRRLVGARLRADWQYRASTLLFTIGQAGVTVLDLLAIVVVFEHVQLLAGWTLWQVLLLYGTSGLAFGIGDLLVSPVERVNFHVRQGTFDRFLIRPVSPLVQLCCEEFAFRRVGRVVQPAIIIALAVGRAGIAWTPAKAFVLAITVVSGTVIFSALWVATSSVAFWTVETQELANSFTYGGGFLTQYPLDVLTPWLRRLAVIVPLAFVNYLPMTWVTGRADAAAVPAAARFLSPAVAAALAFAASAAWRSGIGHYRSTGT